MEGPGIQGVRLEPIESHYDRGRTNLPADHKRDNFPGRRDSARRRANNARDLPREDSPNKRLTIIP